MSEKTVSLVIPGRNCAGTLRQCLGAVAPLLQGPALREIIFIDDGSTDDTRSIAGEFPVTVIEGAGRGPGAARNAGWRAANHPFVWFVDADCVANPDALDKLVGEFDENRVGAVSGSYRNMVPHSLLACLIHQEIIERHRKMPKRVDFLATFNVVYRRSALERVDGFDERFLKGQDAELSWRVMDAGYELRFVFHSRVGHYHETRWLRYLSTQRQQGYWRVWLHLAHSGHAAGDSYSSFLDHMQPPLAMLCLASSPLPAFDHLGWITVALLVALAAAQLPLTLRMVSRLRSLKYTGFALLSFLRAFWRGVGMTQGVFSYLLTSKRDKTAPKSAQT